MPRSELVSELRALRKDHVKSISKMKMNDISVEIERLKTMRAETPPVASIPSAPVKVQKSAVESIKKAKEVEFPVAPAEKGKKSAKKSVPPPKAVPKKKASAPVKKSKAERMLEIMEGSESDEE
jgi:CO dehydrogenase/acetyl-CoA synthase delta subunit